MACPLSLGVLAALSGPGRWDPLMPSGTAFRDQSGLWFHICLLIIHSPLDCLCSSHAMVTRKFDVSPSEWATNDASTSAIP